jgi:hypothetical protein
MPRILKHLKFFWYGLFITLLTPVHAVATDMRVLVDVSGSMRWNDPQNLRVPALRLLAEFLPQGSTVGIWLFAEDTERLHPPEPVDSAWRERVTANLGRIHSRGLFTDIEDAILTATADWESPADGETRHLLLFTDGLVDVADDTEASEDSRQRLINDHIIELQEANIQLHGIGLSDEIDAELMQQLTSRTGGWLEIAQDAETLQRIFMRMLEQTAAPTTVPLLDNHFEIDERIQEFTVLIFRTPDQAIALINPNGQRISQDDSAVMAMRWLTQPGYDLITVDTPEAGTWQIDAPQDPDNRVVVVTDLGLAMTPPPNTVRSGEAIPVDAWVTEQGQLLQNLDFLEVLAAKAQLTAITTDVQTQHPLLLESATHHFHGQFATTELPVGTYQLDVQIDSGTFQRQIRRRIEVVGAPVIITYTPVMPTTPGEPARLIADLMIDTQAINSSTLFGYLRLTGPDEQLTIAEIRAVSGSAYQLELPMARPGDYQISAHLSARDRHGDSVIFDMETEQLSVEFEPGSQDTPQRSGLNWAQVNRQWLDILLLVVVSNAILMLLLVLIWLIFRPSRKPAAQQPPSAPRGRR